MAEFNGRAWGLIPVANRQGMIAGKCACGHQGEYTEILPSPMLKIASLNITSVGDISEDDEKKSADKIQKLTDSYIKEIAVVLDVKENEIMEI